MIALKHKIASNQFIILIVSLILRLYQLNNIPIWHDEAFTYWIIKLDFLEIIRRTALDVHPPFYYLVLKAWSLIFGNSIFSLRLLSVLFSVGAILVFYEIVKRLFTSREAFWASLVLAFSPYLIFYSQEIRMYSLALFLGLLASLFFLKLIEKPRALNTAMYSLFLLLSLYTHYYGFLMLLSHLIIVAFYLLKEKNWRVLKNFAFANFAVFLLFAPWVRFFYAQVSGVSNNYWIKSSWYNFSTIPETLVKFFIFPDISLARDIYGLYFSLFVLAILVIIAFVFLRYKERQGLFIISVFSFLPLFASLIFSLFVFPIYHSRYLFFSSAFFLSFFGIFLTLVSKKIKWLFGVVFVTLFVLGNLHSVNTRRESRTAPRVAKNIVANLKAGDLILSSEIFGFFEYSYYVSDEVKLFESRKADRNKRGEYALIWDDDRYFLSLSDLSNLEGRIWLVGRPKSNRAVTDRIEWLFKSELVYKSGKGEESEVVLLTR